MSFPAALELEGVGLDPKCSAHRIHCLVTAFLMVFRIQEKANVFWLRTLEGGKTASHFQPRTPIGKDPSLTLILLLSPLLNYHFHRASKAKATGNSDRGQNKARTTRDLRWQFPPPRA